MSSSPSRLINQPLRLARSSRPMLAMFEGGARQRNRGARSESDHHMLAAGQGVRGPLTRWLAIGTISRPSLQRLPLKTRAPAADFRELFSSRIVVGEPRDESHRDVGAPPGARRPGPAKVNGVPDEPSPADADVARGAGVEVCDALSVPAASLCGRAVATAFDDPDHDARTRDLQAVRSSKRRNGAGGTTGSSMRHHRRGLHGS